MSEENHARRLDELVRIMHRLRAPGGCPWDQEQSHATLKPFLIEEAYEVIEAIDGGSDEALCDELGDVLLQVVFHAELATERGAFTIDDVIDTLRSKLVRRHPHVFGDVTVDSSADVVVNWMRLKREERVAARAERNDDSPACALEGVPRGMPALLRAHRLGQKASAVGFDWASPAGAKAKIDEELSEIEEAPDTDSLAEELGDLLFAACSYARLHGVNAENALHSSLDRFEQRFRIVEREAAAQGLNVHELSADQIDALWKHAKEKLG